MLILCGIDDLGNREHGLLSLRVWLGHRKEFSKWTGGFGSRPKSSMISYREQWCKDGSAEKKLWVDKRGAIDDIHHSLVASTSFGIFTDLWQNGVWLRPSSCRLHKTFVAVSLSLHTLERKVCPSRAADRRCPSEVVPIEGCTWLQVRPFRYTQCKFG